MVVINGASPTEMYEPNHAEAVAKQLQDSDPEWNYRVVHDPTGEGMSYIEVLDEEGVLIAPW